MRTRALPIRDIATGDRNLDRLQEDSVRRADAQNKGPWSAGVEIEATLQPGLNAVNHKLGAIPSRWAVVDATVSVPQLIRTAWDSKTITLSHAGPGPTTVKLWVS